jgi:3D (Asp-Asp-Asp) domain-containing protein
VLTLSGRATLIVAALGVAGCLLVTGSSLAGPAPALRAKGVSLDHRAHQALLGLYALETSLARAHAESVRLKAALDDVTHREAALERRATVVRRSLGVARVRVADVIRRLYMEGGADPIAVVLGASSLDEALTAIDSLRYAAAWSRVLVAQLRARSGRMRTLDTQLAVERRELEAARGRARWVEHLLAERVAERSAFVAGVRREWTLTRARITALEARARAAERRTARLTAARPGSASAQLTDGAPGEVVTAATGTRRLVVESVAYHLRGATATGLPAGPGVVAVDPSVIPLGTRLHVPGYGPAVAADVGSAIKGNVIDLWFATIAHARAWGRRTITITLYG